MLIIWMSYLVSLTHPISAAHLLFHLRCLSFCGELVPRGWSFFCCTKFGFDLHVLRCHEGERSSPTHLHQDGVPWCAGRPWQQCGWRGWVDTSSISKCGPAPVSERCIPVWVTVMARYQEWCGKNSLHHWEDFQTCFCCDSLWKLNKK